MNLTNTQIETLSEKHVRRFLNRLPSAAHMRDDLKQEAAFAIIKNAARWKPEGAPLDHFLYTYTRKAMQRYCSLQAGPVAKPTNDRDFAGSLYGAPGDEVLHMPRHDNFGDGHEPSDFLDRKQADEIVHELVERRAQMFSGKGKLSHAVIKDALTDMLSGDTCLEVAKRYGCSKQRMSMLAAQAGI